MEDSLPNYLAITKHLENNTPEISPEQLLLLQKQKQCRDKALRIVELLIEGKLRPQILFKCLPYIDQDYYADVVEERAITKICGYPLCDQKLDDMPKKRFYINVKTNTVTDISERKNYCSQFCYKASVHLKSQVETRPLWLRNFNTNKTFQLLSPADMVSEAANATEAKKQPDPVKETSTFTSIWAFADVSLQEILEMDEKPNKTVHVENDAEIIDATEPSTSNSTDSNCRKPESVPKRTMKPKEQLKVADILQIMRKNIQSWLTLNTYIYIYGLDQLRHILTDSHLKQVELQQANAAYELKYEKICDKLRVQELAEQKMDRVLSDEINFQPTPDFQQLKDVNHAMEVKVRSFYQGEAKKNWVNKEEGQETEAVDEETMITPVINNKKLIRQRIFLSPMQKSLHKIITTLAIDQQLVFSELKCLVQTFNLQADNIAFKSILWNLFAVVILELLAVKDSTIKAALERSNFQQFEMQMFNRYPGGYSGFCNLMTDIRDFQTFITNCNVDANCSGKNKDYQ